MPQQKSYPFYEQGKLGKNEWWRFFLVIGLTLLVEFFFLLIFIFPLLDIYQYEYGENYWEYIDGQVDQITYSDTKYFIIEVIILNFLVFGSSIIIFLIFFKLIHKRKILSLITGDNRSFRWKRFFKINALFLTVFISLALILQLLYAILSYIDQASYPFNYLQTIIDHPFLLVILFASLIIQVFAEEVIFRGYLPQYLNLYFKRLIIPFIFIGALFGLAHMVTGLFFWFFLSSIFLSIFAYRENGLEVSITEHLVRNFMAFSLSLSLAKQEINPAPTLEDLLFGLSAEVILFVVFTLVLYGKKGFDMRFLFQENNRK